MKSLKIFSSADVHFSELQCLNACLDSLRTSFHVSGAPYSEYEIERELSTGSSIDLIWIWSKNWRKSIADLTKIAPEQKAFISVLSTRERNSSIWSSVFDRSRSKIPRHITLITHSSLSYRFLTEMVGISKEQVVVLPLPMPSRTPKNSDDFLSVGCLCPLVEESNLHFVLTVAHYLKRKTSSFEIVFSGQGILKTHLESLATELNLKKQVKFNDSSDLSSCEVFLYFANKSDHFAPLLVAASKGIAPISKRLPEIESFISDTQTGFVFNEEDPKAVGELLLSLSSNKLARRELGIRFQREVENTYSPQKLRLGYSKLLEEK